MRQRTIVVVEDEKNIREVISYNLKREGYRVLGSDSGEEGLELVRNEQPDCVLLDLMLPGLDGVEICRRIKSDERLRDIPVLMVTAKAEESDIVLGLGIGADDYIPKPFSPKELIARVKAALRRGPLRESKDSEKRITLGSVVIDTVRHEVTVEDELLDLTPMEFRLLHRLASQPGRVYSREELLDLIGSRDALVLERNIDVHIKSLRKKLGDRRDMIETVRGVGYRVKDS